MSALTIATIISCAVVCAAVFIIALEALAELRGLARSPRTRAHRRILMLTVLFCGTVFSVFAGFIVMMPVP